MYGFDHNHTNRIKGQDMSSLQHTQDTFKAYVDLIVPRSHELAEEYGRIQYLVLLI